MSLRVIKRDVIFDLCVHHWQRTHLAAARQHGVSSNHEASAGSFKEVDRRINLSLACGTDFETSQRIF